MLSYFIIGLLCVAVLCVASIVVSCTVKLVRRIVEK